MQSLQFKYECLARAKRLELHVMYFRRRMCAWSAADAQVGRVAVGSTGRGMVGRLLEWCVSLSMSADVPCNVRRI